MTKAGALLDETITVGEGDAARPIAVIRRTAVAGAGAEPSSPGYVWLGGFRSEMAGTKAVALDAFAAERGAACLRHDYSGHGVSGGRFADGTISRWLEESLAVFDRFADGPQILVGSSMGAWIALLMTRHLRNRAEGKPRAWLSGLLLIAPAPDFTSDLMEPHLTDAQRDALENQGFFEEPTPYGPEPHLFTRALFEDGRKNRVLDGIIETGCPVTILQGMEDRDVPYAHALRLVEHLPADDVVLTLVRDGDHRLSRPEDIERMRAALAALAEI